MVSAFGLGCVVTGIESVCTGQVYVPTLALVVKRGADLVRGMTYLAVYNLMFILPLVVVLLLSYRGLRLFSLIEWSKHNVVTSKALMAASLPTPGPLTLTSADLIPCSMACFRAFCAASCAANGVLFLEPLKPCRPALEEATTFPRRSVIVMMVLLKVDWM